MVTLIKVFIGLAGTLTVNTIQSSGSIEPTERTTFCTSNCRDDYCYSKAFEDIDPFNKVCLLTAKEGPFSEKIK